MRFYIHDGSLYYNNNLGFTWIRKMKRGEILYFWVSDNALRSGPDHPITFTAELLLEN